jgi:hypothetical protein
VTVASDASCNANRSTLRTIGSCATLGADPTPPAPPFLQSRSAFYTESSVSGGTCIPSARVVTGSAVATNPLTFCCTVVPPRFRLPVLRPKPPDAGAD